MPGSLPYRLTKRMIDLVGAATLIVLFAPVMIVVALLVLIFLGRPVLFRQLRPGLNGRLFTISKFRTMKDARTNEGEPMPDAVRLTPLGRALRRFSLDELPQLFNVLTGDLSLVGPRPLLPEYLPLYSAQQSKRHLVKPGITGWAQVNGRNAITWTEKFAHDVWYVEHQSLALDLKILFLTARKVLLREGINAAGEATAAKFTGNES